MSELRVRTTLPEDEIEKIVRLVDSAAEHDGVGPLSERSLLWLRGGGGGDARGLLQLDEAGGLVGYAHLDPATDDETAAGEFVVAPEVRRRGHGLALLRGLRQEADGPLRVWAHGDLPAATALAGSEGLDRVRALFQMRRSMDDPFPKLDIADGVRLRTFKVGEDEEAWLQVNRRAFAHHPEQGAWTLDDVRLREREPWFDPEGFFLAESERDGKLMGFHWTKTHPDGLGEVYVVGVDPDAQGLGLGRTLTLKGLQHLRERGVPAVLLYVDESNGAAVRLYESLSFTRYSVDVMFQTAA
ncbi:mycothiol synthase [Spirillospora sp. NPDC048911]|uniref:mycothiol synthase n=1 Tax=Spirillospora sp. NPDC048911 TaxID=3364527 RepID=UPI00371B2713